MPLPLILAGPMKNLVLGYEPRRCQEVAFMACASGQGQALALSADGCFLYAGNTPDNGVESVRVDDRCRVHGTGTVLFNMATNPVAAGLAPPVIVAVDRLLDVECMYSTGWAAGDEGKGYDQHGDESESYDGVFSWQ